MENALDSIAPDAIITLPAGIEILDFVPVAFYDSYMDCIRVMTADRSMTEDRVNDELTLYQTNHASAFDPIHCGFCLKGIRHIFDELGVAPGEEVRLAQVIDAVVKANPQSTVAKILGEFPANDDMVVHWEQREAA